MAVSWRSFLPYILPDVPQCPKNVASDAAREAAIEFCEQTHIWRMRSDPTTIVEGHSLYTPDTPPDCEVSFIQKVKLLRRDADGKIVGASELIPLNDLDLDLSGSWELREGDTPQQYRFFEPDRIQLIPAPEESLMEALKVEVAVKPTRTAGRCPQFLLSSYSNAIGFGAKKRLAAIPGKAWSNPGMVQYYSVQFQKEVNKAIRTRNTANSRKELRVRMPNFV